MRPASDDPYAVLGVTPRATAAQLRQAYRALVRRHHPDLCPPGAGHDQTLEDVMHAYEVLGDPVRRADHDRRHTASAPPPRARAFSGRAARDGFIGTPPIQAGPIHWVPWPDE